MFTFNSFISVHLCAPTPDVLAIGQEAFRRVISAHTPTGGNFCHTSGFWHLDPCEADILATWEFDNCDNAHVEVLRDIVLWIVFWRVFASQQAVLFTIVTPKYRLSLGVEDGDTFENVWKVIENSVPLGIPF